METPKPKTTRRSRRKKPVEVIADIPTLNEAKLEAEGFEKVRARNDRGHFVADDPSTPENEAFQWEKPLEIDIKDPPAPSPKSEPKPKPKPWQKPIRPMKQRKSSGTPRGQRRDRR